MVPQRRAVRLGGGALLLAAGAVLVALAVDSILAAPLDSTPNYYENHTGELSRLILTRVVPGAVLGTVGTALVLDDVFAAITDAETAWVRAAGGAAVVGGLLQVTSRWFRNVVYSAGIGDVLPLVVAALLVVGVAGLVARRATSGPVGHAAAVLAAGLVVRAVAAPLGAYVTALQPRVGAMSYPGTAVELVGTVAVVIGAVATGAAYLRAGDDPRWLGWVFAVGVPLLALLSITPSTRLVGVAPGLLWIAVGAGLLRHATPPRRPDGPAPS